MDVIVRFLLRLILVPLGGVLAVAAATTMIFVARWRAVEQLIGAGPSAQGDFANALFEGGPLLALLLSIWLVDMFVPAAVGVLISEALAVRSWMYHAANGGLSAWLGWALTRDLREEYRFLDNPEVLIAAGLAAGLVYWLIAGRTAGFWKPVRTMPPLPAKPAARQPSRSPD